MTDHPPLSPDQEKARAYYVPILRGWLRKKNGGGGGSFDHHVVSGKLAGFKWRTDDGRRGIVSLANLDEYLTSYTVTYHGGINHGEVETGQGVPAEKTMATSFQQPSDLNGFADGEESTLYELKIVNEGYEFHAVQSWDGPPPDDALERND